jgi:RNA polymerase sigma factor (sigma-70 family)
VTPPAAPNPRAAPSLPGASSPSAEALATIRRGAFIIALKELRDSALADECAQETIVRLLDAMARTGAKPIGDIGAFARGIARHVIADTRSARARSDAIELVENSVRYAAGTNALDAMVMAEQHARVGAALASLSDADRELLHVLFLDDSTPGELAQRTGEPAERVRKRKSRALDRLRRAFLGHDSATPTTGEVDEP